MQRGTAHKADGDHICDGCQRHYGTDEFPGTAWRRAFFPHNLELTFVCGACGSLCAAVLDVDTEMKWHLQPEVQAFVKRANLQPPYNVAAVQALRACSCAWPT